MRAIQEGFGLDAVQSILDGKPQIDAVDRTGKNACSYAHDRNDAKVLNILPCGPREKSHNPGMISRASSCRQLTKLSRDGSCAILGALRRRRALTRPFKHVALHPATLVTGAPAAGLSGQSRMVSQQVTRSHNTRKRSPTVTRFRCSKMRSRSGLRRGARGNLK